MGTDMGPRYSAFPGWRQNATVGREALLDALGPAARGENLAGIDGDRLAKQINNLGARHDLAVNRYLEALCVSDPHGQAGFIREAVDIPRPKHALEEHGFAVADLEPAI